MENPKHKFEYLKVVEAAFRYIFVGELNCWIDCRLASNTRQVLNSSKRLSIVQTTNLQENTLLQWCVITHLQYQVTTVLYWIQAFPIAESIWWSSIFIFLFDLHFSQFNQLIKLREVFKLHSGSVPSLLASPSRCYKGLENRSKGGRTTVTATAHSHAHTGVNTPTNLWKSMEARVTTFEISRGHLTGTKQPANLGLCTVSMVTLHGFCNRGFERVYGVTFISFSGFNRKSSTVFTDRTGSK